MTGAKEKAQEDCPIRKAVHSHSYGEVENLGLYVRVTLLELTPVCANDVYRTLQ